MYCYNTCYVVYSTKDVHQIEQCNSSIFYWFQCGIISPILFNVYMDELSVLLNSSNIGVQIGHTFLNHLCDADDLCLSIRLSSAGMQKLLNLCSKNDIDQSLKIYSSIPLKKLHFVWKRHVSLINMIPPGRNSANGPV